MDLRYSGADEVYRSQLRTWLDANLTPEAVTPRTNDPAEWVRVGREWQKRIYEAGYLGLAWPRKYGGQEATLTEQAIVADEMARRRAPQPINAIGLNILGPTLIKHATEEQKQRFLPRILSAEDLWCQGFSEPEAGSDLAALRTRAEVDDGGFVVNGQKVWTSLGPVADWIFLLARTDPSAPKREGISFFVCNVLTPGITIRPLRNAAGGYHFSEVFFDDVRIPHNQLVGELHGGWTLARSTLDSERSGLAGVVGLEHSLRRVWQLATQTPRDGASGLADTTTRRELAQRWIELEGLRHLGYRTLSAQLRGDDPGAEAAVGKLFSSETRRRLTTTALRVEGPLSQVRRSSVAPHRGRWATAYWDALGYAIGGGTSEIMRNVIAERVLGLPRSVED